MMILKNDPRPYFNCQYSVSRSVSSAVGVKELSYNCTVFTDFQHTTLSPFQSFSLSYCIWAINEISCCMSSSVGGFIVGCSSCCVMNWGVAIGGFIVGCMNGGWMGVSLVGLGVFSAICYTGFGTNTGIENKTLVKESHKR